MFADEPDRITNIHGGYPGYVGLAGSWIFFSIDLIFPSLVCLLQRKQTQSNSSLPGSAISLFFQSVSEYSILEIFENCYFFRLFMGNLNFRNLDTIDAAVYPHQTVLEDVYKL